MNDSTDTMTVAQQNLISNSDPSIQLVRRLGLWSAIFVCMSSQIGSGIFLVGSDIANAVQAPFMGLLVWVVAGGITLAGALIFSELGAMFPQAGGQYVFLREAFHPIFSFLFGWTLIFVIQTGSIAAVAVAFAKFAAPFLTMNDIEKNWAASLIILGLTFFNFFGVRRGAQFLDTITLLKIVTIVGIVGFILMRAPPDSASPILLQWREIRVTGLTLSAFGVALLAAFWAFDGWYSITFMAGEMKRPGRDIPLASLIAVVATTLIYVLVSYCYYRVLNQQQMSQSSFIAADAIEILSGPLGVKVIGGIVILSVIGCLNAMIMSGARVVYAMAKDRVLPHGLAKVSVKNHSPNRALTLQMIWSVLLVWSGSYDQLFTYVIFGAFIFYGLTAAAVFVLRKKRPLDPRPYKVPLYPWLPAFYILFTIGITINSIVEKPWESLAGLGIISLGIPACLLLRNSKKATRSFP